MVVGVNLFSKSGYISHILLFVSVYAKQTPVHVLVVHSKETNTLGTFIKRVSELSAIKYSALLILKIIIIFIIF